MYFPYLRGKQFELMALREMAEFMSLNSEKVSPIIEPVKLSSTLAITLKALKEKNINFTIIINPEYGDAVGKTDDILTLISTELAGYSNFQIGLIVNEGFLSELQKLMASIVDYGIACNGFGLVHNTVLSEDELNLIKTNLDGVAPTKWNIINFGKTNSNRRYHRYFNEDTKVSFADYFVSQLRNKDYKDKESQFTEEHKFYSTEGYVGFGDFTTIGDNYSESGFMPYAVAIHISYQDSKGKIVVRHLVSDSNGDTSDVAGKFAEANQKLIDWITNTGISSIAIDEFQMLHSSKHFPGLGIVKKLSIMNHIELMVNSIA